MSSSWQCSFFPPLLALRWCVVGVYHNFVFTKLSFFRLNSNFLDDFSLHLSLSAHTVLAKVERVRMALLHHGILENPALIPTNDMCIGKPDCHWHDNDDRNWKGWRTLNSSSHGGKEESARFGLFIRCLSLASLFFLLLISQLIRPLNNMMVCCSVCDDEQAREVDLMPVCLPFFASSSCRCCRHRYPSAATAGSTTLIHSTAVTEWRRKWIFPFKFKIRDFSLCRAKSSLEKSNDLDQEEKKDFWISSFFFANSPHFKVAKRSREAFLCVWWNFNKVLWLCRKNVSRSKIHTKFHS